MEKAFKLGNGTIIYSKDVRMLIINGRKEEYEPGIILDGMKKTANIGAILSDGTKINPSNIKNYYIFE